MAFWIFNLGNDHLDIPSLKVRYCLFFRRSSRIDKQDHDKISAKISISIVVANTLATIRYLVGEEPFFNLK